MEEFIKSLIRVSLLIFQVSLVLNLSSCIKEEPVPELVDDGSIIFLCEDSKPATKTTLNGLQTEWIANSDKVGLYSPQASVTAGGDPGVVNEPLTALSSGARSQFSGSVYWNTGDHEFYSYYPYMAGTHSYTAVPVSLSADQNQVSGNDSSHIGSLDFLIANPYTTKYPGSSGASATVSLRYNHLFSIIEFQIIRSTGSGSITKVKLSGKRSLAFNSGTIDISQTTPPTGENYVIDSMSDTSKSVTVTLNSAFNPTKDYSTTPKVYMVILPGVHTGDVKIGVESDGMFKEVVKSNVTFKRGKKYIIQVDADNATVPIIDGMDLEPVEVNGVIWAPVNLGYSGDMPYGLVFQWHRISGYGMNAPPKLLNTTLTDLDIGTSITTYKNDFISTSSSSIDWSPVAQSEWNRSEKYNPCPQGWRIPTNAEYQLLFSFGNTIINNANGGVDGLIGRWIGPFHDDPVKRVTNALFFPYPGWFENSPTFGSERRNINNIAGYWTNTSIGANGEVLTIRVNEGYNPSISQMSKSFALPIRCVKNNGYSTPVLYTVKPTDIKYDGAKVGGFIEHQGDLSIIERGVYYGTSPFPTSLNMSDQTIGEGKSDFSLLLYRLEPNKNYYVRAYAKNSSGTIFYGDQYKFTTLSSHLPEYSGQEVEIKGVTWAPWNAGYVEGVLPYGLMYQWGRMYGQTYNDEASFKELPKPNVINSQQGASSANLYTTRDNVYGPKNAPYNWNLAPSAIWDMGLYNPCPQGWRVPTREEFELLISSGSTWTQSGPFGMPGMWFGGDHSGNHSGSIFLPAAGCRVENVYNAQGRGSYGYYWTTTMSTNPSSANLIFYEGAKTINNSARVRSYSVRCVKNN